MLPMKQFAFLVQYTSSESKEKEKHIPHNRETNVDYCLFFYLLSKIIILCCKKVKTALKLQ